MKTLISHSLGKNFIFLIAELSFLIFSLSGPAGREFQLGCFVLQVTGKLRSHGYITEEFIEL